MSQTGTAPNWQKTLFFSNYFYGICAVALSIEAMLQQNFPLNGPLYFAMVFAATVLYYSYPYVRKCNYVSTNARTNWYTRHYSWMRWNQFLFTLLLIIAFAVFLWNHYEKLVTISWKQWILIIVFPVVAALYYGIHFFSSKYNLRKTGWLKPFVIGFIWAGMVTVYPTLFYAITHEHDYSLSWISVLLFVKNFMFITVLCIMFDIKDYAADYIGRLKTFVVNFGLRKTIFYILLPLSLAGLGTFIYYAVTHHFQPGKVLLNTIPFILLIGVAWSLRRRRSLLYYLSVVDGLMLVKAMCGTVAMLYF